MNVFRMDSYFLIIFVAMAIFNTVMFLTNFAVISLAMAVFTAAYAGFIYKRMLRQVKTCRNVGDSFLAVEEKINELKLPKFVKNHLLKNY